MIKAQDAIATARSLLGMPYSELDCINLIKRVIRASPGGVKGYTTAGTNSLWKSATASAKYRDLTWTQEGIAGARAGMLAFKRSGENVHHVGLVTGDGTVVHSSSAAGKVVETALDSSWQLLAVHRYIDVDGSSTEEDKMSAMFQATVTTKNGALSVRDAPSITARRLGAIPKGETVDVLSDSNAQWWRISANGLVGYASTDYLTKVEQESEEQTGYQDGSVTTTLVREDDVGSVTLIGRWRVAQD